MTARFACDVETTGDATWLRLQGELDLSSAPMLRTCMSGITEAGARRIVIDVGGLRFVDASGIRAIAAEARRLRKTGGDVILRNPRPWTRRLFHLLGATDLVTIEEAAAVVDVVEVVEVVEAADVVDVRPEGSQPVWL